MISILPATCEDLSALIDLEYELFSSDRIKARQFKYLLTKANAIIVKAELAGKLSGYMVLLRRKRCYNLRVYSIGVALFARKQGVAGRLLSYAEEIAVKNHLSRLTLEVCEHNERAIRLYNDAGFDIYGQRQSYYEDGCNALLFRKKTCPQEAGNDPPGHRSKICR